MATKKIISVILLLLLSLNAQAQYFPLATDTKKIIADLKTAAEKPSYINNLATQLGFIKADGSIDFQSFHDYLTTIEIRLNKSNAKLSEKERKELSQYISKLRSILERMEQEEFAQTFLEQSLRSLPAAIKETYDIPQAAEKYGYMNNGKIDINAFERGLNEIERQIIDYAQLLEEKYPGKTAQVKKIVAPEFKIARDNINRFKKGK